MFVTGCAGVTCSSSLSLLQEWGNLFRNQGDQFCRCTLIDYFVIIGCDVIGTDADLQGVILKATEGKLCDV